jgi:hypothetical protein
LDVKVVKRLNFFLKFMGLLEINRVKVIRIQSDSDSVFEGRLARRARAFDSVETFSHLMGLSVSEGLDMSMSLQLSADLLVSLDEAIELVGEAIVLVGEDTGMLLEGFKLIGEVDVLGGRRAIDSTLVVDVRASSSNLTITVHKAGIGVLNLSGQVSILNVLAVDRLTEGTVVLGSVIIVSLEVNVFSVELGVQVSDVVELTLRVFKSDLLVAEVSIAAVNETSGVFDLTDGVSEVSIKFVLLSSLVVSFVHESTLDILEVSNFVSHVSSLDLSGLNITVELGTLSIEVSTHVSLSDTLVTETGSFTGLLIEHASSISGFVGQSNTMVRLISEHELKVVKSLAGFTDLITLHVECVALIVLTSGSVVGQHSVASFHVEDFVVNTAVVSLLVSEVVKLLAELSDKLVLFTTADGNAVAI